jgi:cytoskeletal protein CcmA (bactofilin family)
VSIKDFFGFDKSAENQNADGSGFEDASVFASDTEYIPDGIERLSGDDELESVDNQPDEADNYAVAVDIQTAEDSYSGSDDGEYEPAREEAPAEAMNISLIATEAIVTGDIATKGHIDIDGQVKGDIDSKGYVSVQGAVKGNVAGKKIGLYGSRIKGDLKAEVGIVADSNSIIVGDIKTNNIISDGKIKGDIDAESMIVFKSNAYYVGDIDTASLTVESGAILNGRVKMLVDGDSDAPFEE